MPSGNANRLIRFLRDNLQIEKFWIKRSSNLFSYVLVLLLSLFPLTCKHRLAWPIVTLASYINVGSIQPKSTNRWRAHILELSENWTDRRSRFGFQKNYKSLCGHSRGYYLTYVSYLLAWHYSKVGSVVINEYITSYELRHVELVRFQATGKTNGSIDHKWYFHF
jgi:hypothetical protein